MAATPRHRDGFLESINKGFGRGLTLSFEDDTPLDRLIENNELVAFRPGCVESAFVYRKLTGSYLTGWHFDGSTADDSYMKKNAGMYYTDARQKDALHKWYVDHYIDLLHNCQPTLCVGVAHFDIPLLAHLDIAGTCYNYPGIWRKLLENSHGKTILYVGNATRSVQKAHAMGLNNIWKFPVPDFELKCVKTPQTTEGCEIFPDAHMAETANRIIAEIKAVGHFDIAVLGCGAYGAPLLNTMRRLYPGKNMASIGSDCLKMFGILTPRIRWDLSETEAQAIGTNIQYGYDTHPYYNKEYSVWVEEEPEDKNHPEPKYWK